jgi:large conductance mechanosensitive channel
MIRSFFNEFKTFAMRGNVMDMAVGIIIGAAFGKIVSSMVEDVIMPPIGWVLGNVDFSDLKLVLVEKSTEAEEVAIKYGAFLNTVISFIIVAFAVFILIKAVNTLQAKMLKAEADAAANAAPTTKKCPYCCSDIPMEATRCPHCTSAIK